MDAAVTENAELTFAAIDRRRVQLRVAQADLCRRARVNPVTYSRLLAGDHKPQERTLLKLAEALDQIASDKVVQLNARRRG